MEKQDKIKVLEEAIDIIKDYQKSFESKKYSEDLSLEEVEETVELCRDISSCRTMIRMIICTMRQ